MNKSDKRKAWRINIVVDYFDSKSTNANRFYILELLKNLASIYKFDYAISKNHKFPPVPDFPEISVDQIHADLVYFRSNEYTRFERKEFRAIIDCMFSKIPSEFDEGFEIFPQLYKNLKDFPFPTEFYRPLNYPWIEHHNDSQKKLLIYADEVLKVIEEEQDFHLN
jgi:hypothetical protein